MRLISSITAPYMSQCSEQFTTRTLIEVSTSFSHVDQFILDTNNIEISKCTTDGCQPLINILLGIGMHDSCKLVYTVAAWLTGKMG